MTMAEGSRPARVAERIRAELSDMLVRGEVHDPGAQGVVVTHVKASPDLSHARIYVRLLRDVDADRAAEAVDALDRASGFIRRALGKRLGLRFTPILAFQWDEAIDRGMKMERLLDELSAEGKGIEIAGPAAAKPSDEGPQE